MDDFLEKMEAMRMTLELAVHDIEAQRVSTEELRVSIRELRENSAVLLKSTENLLTTAVVHQNDPEALKKMTGELARIADTHERRLNGIEGRI
jgi:hypothetical protein